MKRVFYFSLIATDDLNRKFGYHFHVGAASNKVLGVCSALRSVGIYPVIVSSLIPSTSFTLNGWVVHTRTDGVCFAKIFTVGRGLIKRLVASVPLLLYAMRHVRSEDRVILYNFCPEYIFAALYLWMLGRPAILDIEDAPRHDELGLRGLVNRLSFAILARLSSSKYLVASRQLGKRLGLSNYLPVYGVASYFEAAAVKPNKFEGEKIKVLYGGAILPATGLNMFTDAVRLLAATEPDIPIHFFITGIFPESDIHAFSAEIESSSRIRVTVHSNLSAAEYRALAQDMDIGLCLKLPSRSIGQTTFPSKVVEYAALGMLVCSTAVSDVPDIFNDNTGIVLASERPEELAIALSNIVKDRRRAASLALNSRQYLLERFSSKNVGREVFKFIYE